MPDRVALSEAKGHRYIDVLWRLAYAPVSHFHARFGEYNESVAGITGSMLVQLQEAVQTNRRVWYRKRQSKKSPVCKGERLYAYRNGHLFPCDNGEAKEDYRLLLEFDDGSTLEIDFEPMLIGPLFGQLRDLRLFGQVQVNRDTGTIEWPNGADFSPVILHSWAEYGPRIIAERNERYLVAGTKMLITLDQHPSAQIEVGELLTVVQVSAANVVKDIRENIRNLVGGRMTHYEALIENAINNALHTLDQKALAAGYDGAIGVKISHPVVVEGAVEVVVYGNGFKVVR